jgi:hypothetical protein
VTNVHWRTSSSRGADFYLHITASGSQRTANGQRVDTIKNPDRVYSVGILFLKEPKTISAVF